ncbi:hypothetical protein GR160_03015 [Flavobacterium sp. Sd200]|uniref:hypothetical protein n=1 Tax=Flavobacterium sp. Sd200 TaxID=2692211 RepID=UPI00137172A5|nr:hypothetical protein [Flavobacterium sp. Sd200]MXN90185.1 hypothetical protein [Flavobacterium sp. Sd200]
MDLSIEQKIEILEHEIKNLEYGKQWYSNSPLHSNQLKRTIQMNAYDNRIQDKYKQIKKLSKS